MKRSGATRAPDMRWMRSSPMDAAALRPSSDVAGFELHFTLRGAAGLRGLVAPHTGKAVCLKLEPHRQGVLLIGVGLLEPPHLRFDAEQFLDVMPELVREHVGLREIARRTEALLQLSEEAQIEIDDLIGGTVERAGCGLREAAGRVWMPSRKTRARVA